MKPIHRIALALALGVAALSLPSVQAKQVPSPKSAEDVLGTPPGTVMTKEYVALVGRLAYVWGWPMVNQSNQRAAFSHVPEPGRISGVLPAASIGHTGMLTDYINPEQRFI